MFFSSASLSFGVHCENISIFVEKIEAYILQCFIIFKTKRFNIIFLVKKKLIVKLVFQVKTFSYFNNFIFVIESISI